MKETIKKIRNLLLESTRPIFLFDDDPDGLSAFLILYDLVKAGKGLPLKGNVLNETFAEKINNYQADLVIILDKHDVEQEFIDAIKTKIIWIDHHEPKKPHGVIYLNPRIKNKKNNKPTSQLAYEINPEKEWIASTGIISDWVIPPKRIRQKLEKKYPELLPETINEAPEGLFNTKLGEIARIFSFNLKGKISDVTTSIKILTRIKDPYELLEKKHSQARLIMKKYEQHLAKYNETIENIEIKEEDPLIIYTYDNSKNSYTTDLSNELLYKNPDKIIIIARESNNSYKCSLRASKIRIDKILEKTFEEVRGEGGGHEHACGAVIPSEEFERFIKKIRKEITKQTTI